MEFFKPNNPEYNELYSLYPDTQEELISLLENTLRIDQNKLTAEEERIKNIGWKELECTFFLVPKGTPRPRAGGGHFYVKGASQMKKTFKKFLSDYGILCTRCELTLITYQPTPTNSMTNIEILLAEKGLIRPISTPDFDNLAKTYTDALQGVILLNDNIINPGRVEKYYSIKPRIKILLRYQETFDCKYNERKTLNSIGYKNIFGEEMKNG